jgi:diguanylate cyclase (GGDEF)-like protein/PAS domain S-box-containing protein
MGGSKTAYGPPVCDRVGHLDRFEAVFYFAGAAMAMADRTGRLTDVNAAFGDLFGRSVRDIIGRTLPELFDPSSAASISDAVMKLGIETSSGPDTVRLDVPFTHSGGSKRWAMLTMTHVIDNEEPCVVVVGIDITWRRELRTKLYNEARHDPLTGLPNRMYLQDQLDDALRDPRRGVGACLADLDGFKKVNDAHGHGTGDRLLIAIATALGRDTPGHMVGRVGGDEFLALVVDPTGIDALTQIADRMLAVCSREYQIDEHRLIVSASIGITAPDPTHTTLDSLIRAADSGLYGAKRDGRGRWRVATGAH